MSRRMRGRIGGLIEPLRHSCPLPPIPFVGLLQPLNQRCSRGVSQHLARLSDIGQGIANISRPRVSVFRLWKDAANVTDDPKQLIE